MSNQTIQFPSEITLETLPQLFAAHRAKFGGWTMNGAAPAGTQAGGDAASGEPANPGVERPDGVSEDEWNALGDPGRTALTRERTARQAAESALAASRARPAAPKPTEPAKPADAQAAATKPGDAPDIEKIIADAVTAAIKPFQEAETQRATDQAVQSIQTSVMDAAKDLFLDPTDALVGVDLTQVTDGNGAPDPTKVKAALDNLLERKPHLGKTPDGRRYAPPGSPAGAAASSAPLETKVQETLKRMQAQAGIKPS